MTTGTAIDVPNSQEEPVGTTASTLFYIDINALMEYCHDFRSINSGQEDTAAALNVFGGTLGFRDTHGFIDLKNRESVEIQNYDCINHIQDVEKLGNSIASIPSAAMNAMTAIHTGQKTPGWVWGAIALGIGYAILKQQGAKRTTNRAGLPREIHERLNELSNLPDNWNSYGAPRVDKTALNMTRAILRQVYLELADAPKPFVAPGSDGGLGIEFTTVSGNELLVDVHPDGTAEYLMEIVDTGTQNEERSEGQIHSEYEITALLTRIIG